MTKLAGNFEQHARHYNGYYAPVIGTGNDTFEERLLFVRYEDLVADTGTVVERLARFTGLDLKGFDAKGPWRSLVDFNDAQLSKEAFHAERRGKPLVADRIGIFRQVLPNKAIQTIERVCAPMMNRFGYD